MANNREAIDQYRFEKQKRAGSGEQPSRHRRTKTRPVPMPRAPKAGGREYLIHSKDDFAEAITEAIARRYSGNRLAAARASGVPNSTLKRFQDGRGSAVRHQTLEKLRRLIGSGSAKRLDAALYSPTVRDALSDYDVWVVKEIRALEWGRMGLERLRKSTDPEEQAREVSDLVDRSGRLMTALKQLTKKYPSAWRPLHSQLIKRGHFQARARLAQLRVIAPLLDCEDTSHIERARSEMSDSELERYIKAGAVREAILLDRETDIRRAQQENDRLARIIYDW